MLLSISDEPTSSQARRTPAFGAILAALLVAINFGGCWGTSTPKKDSTTTNPLPKLSPTNADPAYVSAPIRTGFVGSQACQKCHMEAFESYHHHPMAASVGESVVDSEVEDFNNASFSYPNGLSYYVEKTQSGVFHHERKTDSAGEQIYDQAVEIDYAIGSGRHGRTYLINRSGRFFASPLTWYTRDHKWGLSPGYSPLGHARFDRQVSDGCINCHVGQTLPHKSEANRFEAEPFSERSIGCERCHGPGADHIQFRTNNDPANSQTQTPDPIFNPANVTDARRDAVCNQCHLAGSRRVVLTGRTEFDFQPGMNLSDNWVIFLKTGATQTTEASAVSHGEQMYSSKCFIESKTQLGCITCHSGHELPKQEAVGAFYREKCVACHAPGKTECSEPLETRLLTVADDSCIACHMPRFAASDVHATQTDHRLLKRPNKPDSYRADSSLANEAPVKVFEEPGVKIRDQEMERALGIYLAEQSVTAKNKTEARDAIELLSPLVNLDQVDVQATYAMGQALEVFGKPDLAILTWQKLLKANPVHEDALESLAVLNHQKGHLKEASEYYQRLIEVNPERPNNYGRLAHVLGQLDEIPRGIEMAEKALSLNPSLTQTHEWLVIAYNRLGNAEQAAVHEKKLRQFQSIGKQPETAPK